jgi:hypothetical protein
MKVKFSLAPQISDSHMLSIKGKRLSRKLGILTAKHVVKSSTPTDTYPNHIHTYPLPAWFHRFLETNKSVDIFFLSVSLPMTAFRIFLYFKSESVTSGKAGGLKL